MDIFRTPEERFLDLVGYPFTPHYVDVNGVRMHYVDEGRGDPVLLLHGEPTWSFLYRKMIPPLAERYRVLAPDYIGFGKSDKPTDDAYYTFAQHYANLAALIAALDRLERITLVVQDWGGPLGLRLATQQPGRFSRLVILNTGLLSGDADAFTPGLLRWIEVSPYMIDKPISELMRRSFVSVMAGDDVLRGYDAPFPNRESRAGARRFPLIIPRSTADPGAREMIETREALSRWPKPTLVMFGERDAVFPPAVAEGLVKLIPRAEGPLFVQGAGHYVQEEAGDALAQHMLEFMSRT